MEFQSTHPHGVRRFHSLLELKEFRVSIHAPTRGATFRFFHKIIWRFVSIHAPTRGATQQTIRINRLSKEFQSTHPHGVRPNPHELLKFQIGFNPRTHTGCDVPFCAYGRSANVSIHAPTRGATSLVADATLLSVFQSTHPHGVRRYANILY